MLHIPMPSFIDRFLARRAKIQLEKIESNFWNIVDEIEDNIFLVTINQKNLESTQSALMKVVPLIVWATYRARVAYYATDLENLERDFDKLSEVSFDCMIEAETALDTANHLLFQSEDLANLLAEMQKLIAESKAVQFETA